MKTYSLSIVTPDGSAYSGQAVSLSVRGLEGELAVMAGHVPFVTSLKPCTLTLETPDDQLRTGRVNGGILTVSNDSVTLLTSHVDWQ
ncbi:MAG: F0F1 ATP synthase subunit epsilon [Candidatus Spyradocola sp.]